MRKPKAEYVSLSCAAFLSAKIVGGKVVSIGVDLQEVEFDDEFLVINGDDPPSDAAREALKKAKIPGRIRQVVKI